MHPYVKITYAYRKLVLIGLAAGIALLLPLTKFLISRSNRSGPVSPPKLVLSPMPSSSNSAVPANQEQETQPPLTPQPTMPAEEIKKIKEKLPAEIPQEVRKEIEKVLRGEG